MELEDVVCCSYVDEVKVAMDCRSCDCEIYLFFSYTMLKRNICLRQMVIKFIDEIFRFFEYWFIVLFVY